MSGGLSQQARSDSFARWAGGSPAAAPTAWFVLLCATDPGDAATIGGSEAAAGSYARVALNAISPGTSPAWAAPTAANPTVLANANAFSFPASSAAWTNSPFGWYGIASASTAGNLLASGSLTSPVAVAGSGVTVTFAIGQLQQTAARTP